MKSNFGGWRVHLMGELAWIYPGILTPRVSTLAVAQLLADLDTNYWGYVTLIGA